MLDTNVASDLFVRRTLPRQVSEALRGASTAITFVTVGELTKWTDLRNWGSARRNQLEGWLSRHEHLEPDDAVAVTWGHLAAAAIRRGRKVSENDTWIAACCLVDGVPLATLNMKDFVGFARYHGLDLRGVEEAEELDQ
ncbi:PIN domain-containing protein [Cryptosporangium phraense]|uniref:PIN domain-containing protein n=1 Tax=Cryptosporangium phraense TaxID=2593070 RepID=UPI00197A97D0|nr:PIN domain-containing protein [Cryptosporangium phraense]